MRPAVPAASSDRRFSWAISDRMSGQLAVTVSCLTRAEIITQSEEQQGECSSENGWYGATSRHGHSKFGS